MNFLKKTHILLESFFSLILWVFVLTGLALIVRVCVCDQFPVPSRSMEPAIIPGDHIVVNKLIFGARIYKNLDFLEGKPLETFRVRGFRKIRRNDILVFNAPLSEDWKDISFDIRKVFAKRCLALPGDTLSIHHGFYLNSGTRDTLGYYPAQSALSAMSKESLPPVILESFPHDSIHYGWDIKDFGPLFIPGKGDRLVIHPLNYLPYQKIIEYETGQRIFLKDSTLLLNNTEISEYIFQKDYYFMGGDNILDSQDSRYFGFVPEEFIIGVVQHILYHKNRDTGRTDWKRFLQKI